MSEDSWSNNDSSSNDGSSSGSSSESGWNWSDAAAYAAGELAGNVLDSFLEPSTQSASPSAEQAALLNPAIQALFLAGEGQGRPPRDERSLVRQLAEAAHWYVPLDSEGGPLLETLSMADAQTSSAFTVPLGYRQAMRRGRPPRAVRRSDGGRRRRNRRRQGDPPAPPPDPERPRTLLRIWPEDPGRPARLVSGYELARLLPADLDALIVMRSEQPVFGLWQHELQQLAAFADGHDLEALLLNPGPGQLAALRTARWWIPNGPQALDADTYAFDRLVRIYTQPEDGYEDDQPLQPITGAALCERLARWSGWDGIIVNIGSGIRDGVRHEEQFELGPDFAWRVLAGIDPRPGAGPLPARTMAEIELWAEIVEFAREGREIVPVPEPPGAMQIRATGTSRWRPDQPVRFSDYRPGPVEGPVFTISQPDARPGDLGDGRTEILCAGLLARYLENKGSWHPSRWFVPRSERVKAAHMAAIATELLKLIPPGEDTLPRSALRTVTGAQYARDRSWCCSRARIEQTLERFHRAATHWLPSFW